MAEGQTPKSGKRRGRPPGSRNSASVAEVGKSSPGAGPEAGSAASVLPENEGLPEAESPALSVEVAAPSEVKPKRHYTPRKQSEAQAKQTASVILVVLDGMVGLGFGPRARMTEEEAEAILDPLARIMLRLDPVTNAAIEKWTDPVMLAWAVSMWGLRIATLPRPGGGSGKAPDEASPITPGGNGAVKEAVAILETGVPPASPPESVREQMNSGGTFVG